MCAAPEINANVPIQADDSFSDYTSDSLASSTQSITESVLEHVYANGRSYHRKSAEKYTLPSDETEKDRLDLAHHWFTLANGGELYTAPLESEKLHNVLDVGTGTGIWALDFGELHRNAQVIGVDISPLQPSWTAPNVKFEIDDVEQEWTYKKNHFDFIHSRMVGLSIRDWPKFAKQLYDHIVPGGYVELSEHSSDQIYCDDGTTTGSDLEKYFHAFVPAMAATGVNVSLDDKFLVKHLTDAGFVDVKVTTHKLPWGAWAKNKQLKYMGAVAAEVLSSGLEAYALYVLTKQGYTPEEMRKLIDGAFTDIRGRKVHGYQLLWQVHGRKPE